MGKVIPLRKDLYDKKALEVPVIEPEYADVPHEEPRKRSWLWLFMMIVACLGYGIGFWISASYGNSVNAKAVANGMHPSTAFAVGVMTTALIFGIFIAISMRLIFDAWSSCKKWARRIRGE